jgi:hypothetical protein
MKKILLATSALVLSAVAANAQAVRIGGEGRMGVIYESVSFGAFSASEWAQENRLQFNFSVSVEADHGLSFGAFTRARITNGNTGVFSGSRVWVEANNFRLTFGNVDGAIRGAGTSHGYAGGCGIGYVGGHYCGDSAGLLGLSTLGLVPGYFAATGTAQPGQTHGFASTAGGPAARIRLDYSFGDTRVALSYDRDNAVEIGVRSRFDAFTVALGYSNRVTYGQIAAGGTGLVPFSYIAGSAIPRAGSVLALSGHYNGGTWGVGLLVVRQSYSNTAVFTTASNMNHTNWSLSGNVELAGGNLYAYVGRVHLAGIDTAPAVSFAIPANVAGISYGYGLGGGATLTAGIETARIAAIGIQPSARFTSASVGVAFNF